MRGEAGGRWWGGVTLPLAAALEEAHDLAQPGECEQWGGVLRRGNCWCARIVSGAHGERGVGPIREPDDQVWINTVPDPDQQDPLAAQRVIGMGDRDGFRRGLGKWGSVL